MCRKSATQWILDIGNEPASEAILAAWTVYRSWNYPLIQPPTKINMTQQGETELVHDLPVKNMFLRMMSSKMFVCTGALSKTELQYALHKCTLGNWNVSHLKECPLQHEILLHNEAGMLVRLGA